MFTLVHGLYDNPPTVSYWLTLALPQNVAERGVLVKLLSVSVS